MIDEAHAHEPEATHELRAYNSKFGWAALGGEKYIIDKAAFRASNQRNLTNVGGLGWSDPAEGGAFYFRCKTMTVADATSSPFDTI
jgi:hypothetical protein